MDKLIKETELLDLINKLKIQGKKIVTTNGCFDILHAAHISLLKTAKNEGDLLVVLLNSDISVKKNKGPKRPIISEKERMEMLASIQYVDYIYLFDEEKVIITLEKIKPHVHIKGGTYIKERVEEEEKMLNQWGGKLLFLENIEGYSTTRIINKILEIYK
jgi:rfaE bifunctional protein nucleotidyltransferase chain/domain